MREPAERPKVPFTIGGAECAAYCYPGTSGACAIMTRGFALTREPGTEPARPSGGRS
jgi:uncharacterized protein